MPSRPDNKAPDPLPLLLSVHSAKRGGAERMALAEARYLTRWFDVVAAVPEGPLREEFAHEIDLVPGSPSMPTWGADGRIWAIRAVSTLFHAVRFARLIRSRGIRLVLTNSAVSLAPTLGARLARVPVIVHARDVPRSSLAPLVFRIQASLADTVIAVSKAMVPWFSGHRARVVLIPEGIAIPQRPAMEKPPEFRSPLRLTVIGGIDRRKGQDVAIEAVRQLAERGLEAELTLTGRIEDSAFASELRSASRANGLQDRVILAGEADNVDCAFANADIVLVPSRGEWTPLVLMEALARGMPVIASDVGGIPDIVQHGHTGLLTRPEDPEAVADAVIRLVDGPQRAFDMARQGREHVIKCFSLDVMLDSLHRELLRQANGMPFV